MNVKLKSSILALGFVAVSSASATVAIADERPENDNYWVQPIPELANQTYFDHDKDFFTNRTFGRQFAWIFGFGFPDREIHRDGESFHQLYEYLFDRQARSGPIIRTPDLVNPYNSSLFTLPAASIGNRPVPRGEFVFETLPPR